MKDSLDLSDYAKTSMLRSFAALLDGARLCLYDGDKPKASGAKLTTQNLLAEFMFNDPAFDENLTALPMDPEKSAKRSGVASWGRCFDKSGYHLFDGTAGTNGEMIELSKGYVEEGGTISVKAVKLRSGE